MRTWCEHKRAEQVGDDAAVWCPTCGALGILLAGHDVVAREWRYADRPSHVKCPGCGDGGDAAHIAACVHLAKDQLAGDGWERGARYVVGLVKTQVGRRGEVDFIALDEAIEAVAPTVKAWGWR